MRFFLTKFYVHNSYNCRNKECVCVKVNFDLINKKQNTNKNVNFEGYKPVKDSCGNRIYEFNYPYDSNKYDCYLEVCKVGIDKNNNDYHIIEGLKSLESKDGFYKLRPTGNRIDLEVAFGLRKGQDFAYHYALVPKGTDRNDENGPKPIYKIDAGDHIDLTGKRGRHEVYNIVSVDGPMTCNGGSMKLLMPDFYNPMWTYDNDGKIVKNPKYKSLRHVSKTFSNKLGGNLAGIEKDVKSGKFNGYSRIISTPIFTDDDLASHAYWNKNCMQMAQSLGNLNNYVSLQKEMFKKGINFVSDGAYVNEGLEGVHFTHVLKWGEQSPYFNWFKAHNIKNNPLSLGVFSQNNHFTSHKLVNSKYIYTQDVKTGKINKSRNKDYDDKKPTYIQIFDDRLVSDKFKNDNTRLIKAYDILNTKSHLDINTHNDTIMPYAFEINSETYDKNIEILNQYNSNARNQVPEYIDEAFDFAVDTLISKNKAPEKNKIIKDSIKKATAEIEQQNPDAKYQLKVDLIMNKAVNDYGLELSDNAKTKLTDMMKKLKNTIRLDSYMGTRFVSKFENFELEEKFESEFDTWDANTDIAKLNYLYSKADTMRIKLNYELEDQQNEMDDVKRKNFEVQDYAIESSRYWTGKTSDILNLYVAQQLTGIDPKNPQKAYLKILDNIDKGSFPEKLKPEINKAIIRNVLTNEYQLDGANSDMEYKKYLLAGLMSLPLDSIEFGDNLVSVLASPYITKRATTENTLGATRYDMYVQKNPHLRPEYEATYRKMDKIYEKEISDFAKEIIDNLNAKLPPDVQLYKGYNTTTYGKYVIPHISETITKYAIVKALAPNVAVNVNPKTGEIIYDYTALKNTSLQSIGITIASSPEDEAKQVLDKLKSGLKKISTTDKKVLIDALASSLKGTNENSFKLAEMITDRLNAGLDWRIDATKDIGDINGVRGGDEKIEDIWNDVTVFWKNFADAVYSQNRNSYIVAEITDEGTLHSKGHGVNSSKYKSPTDMIKKFLRETNMTSTANYSFYFSSILNLFGEHFDPNDKKGSDGFNPDLSHRMNDKSGEFFHFMPYTGILNSYNFIGNHDKPRALHGLIIDTKWYTTDLRDTSNTYYREKAYRILNHNYLDPILKREPNEKDDDYNGRLKAFSNAQEFENASGKALAMAESLQKGFEKAIQKKYPYNSKPDINRKVTDAIYKSLADLANGSYKGETFSSEGFGVKPLELAIDIVIEQAKSEHHLNISQSEIDDIKTGTLRAILQPALKKLQAMTEVLSVMPGMPTLYAGDDIGATGYESETKNIYLQNRGYIHNEWLDKSNTNFNFIQEHYNKMNKYMTMRNRPELHALNDGAPFLLDFQQGTVNGNRTIDLSGILRHGTDNSIVISLINTTGINHTFNGEYKPETIVLDSIKIRSDNDINSLTLSKGLTPGTIFYNAENKNDKYIVREFNGSTFLKHIGATTDEPVIVNGTTLTLYSEAPKRKIVYDKKYYFGPKASDNSILDLAGENLSLVSRA